MHRREWSFRVVVVVALVVAGMSVAVQDAAAGTITVSGGKLVFDQSGKDNNLVVTEYSTYFVVEDTVALSPSYPCAKSGSNLKAICPTASVQSIEVDVGNGSNNVDLHTSKPSQVTGGTGVDRFNGGSGDDTLLGGAGNDTLHGNSGSDEVHGGPGVDYVYGDLGNADLVYGEGDGDYVEFYLSEFGGQDATTTYDGTGDTYDGGEGFDFFAAYPSRTDITHSVMNMISGDMLISGSRPDGGLEIDHAYGMEQLFGSKAPDEIWGNAANNKIYAMGGSDHIITSGGADNYVCDSIGREINGPVSGPDGTADVIDYSLRTAPVNASLDGQPNDGEAGESDNIAFGCENIIGSNYGGTLTGDEHDNTLIGTGPVSGLSGSDFVQGAGSVDGGPGVDIAIGSAGSDLMKGGTGGDLVIGGRGADTYYETPDDAGDFLLDGFVGEIWGRSVNRPDGGEDLFLTGDGKADYLDCGANDQRDTAAPPFSDSFDTRVNC